MSLNNYLCLASTMHLNLLKIFSTTFDSKLIFIFKSIRSNFIFDFWKASIGIFGGCSGCGSVCRVVASDTSGLLLKSSQ